MVSGPIKVEEIFDASGPGRAELDELVKSMSALTRNVRTLGKNLDQDAQRIAAGLGAIVSNTQQLRTQVDGLTGSSDKEAAALAGLASQVSALAREQQNLKAAQAGQAAVRTAAIKADREAADTLKRLQNELRAAFKAQDNDAIVKAANNVRAYKQDIDQLNKALRGANSVYTSVAGSYNRLSVETQQLGERIRALPGGFDSTSAEAAKLKKEFYDNTQRLKDFDRELNQNFREVGAYAKGIIEATRALNGQKTALTQELAALKGQARATHLSAEQQRELNREIERTEAELQKVTGQLNQYGVAAKKGADESFSLKSGAANAAQFFTATYLSVTALLGGLSAMFEANAKYSDQLADVRKTTGLTAEATDELADSLKKVETRTSLEGLLDIAKVGGQLGYAGDQIEDFAKNIDVAVQALGDDFEGGAEQIATELGKISTVFRKDLGDDTVDNIRRVGSAVNELGAEGAATAPFLTDVALRTGATAAASRLGLKDVLAYAATLQETGFNAETSGTALNRLFNTLSTKSKEAYDIAKLASPNLTLKEFKRLVNNDFQGAITLFLRGLREGGTSTTKFNSLLGTLKLQSGEAKSVITTLAQNVDLLADKQAIANDQLTRGTSLADEAAIKNNTLAGSWAKLKNDVNNFFTSGAGEKSLKYFIDFTRGALNFKEGFGAIPRLLGLSKAPVDDFGKALADAALEQRTFADGTDSLLAKFTRLNSLTNRSTAEQAELRKVVLDLKGRLGESAVVLNQETGQYGLNTVAVTKNTKEKRAQFLENATALAKRLQQLEQERATANASASAIAEEAAAKEKLVKANVKLNGGDFNKVLSQQVRQRAQTPTNYDNSEGAIKPEILQAYTDYVALTKQSEDATKKAVRVERERDEVLRQAERLFPNVGDLLALLGQDTKELTEATDDSTEADKKKKQGVADLLKVQYELRKFRLEEQAKDYDRQAENVANADDVRTRAVQKATAARRQIAALDEQEQLHEAALKNAKLIGGDKALATERVLIHERFLAQIKSLGLTQDKQLLALAQATADQLAEVDKALLDEEAKALERIGENENNSAKERQQALLDASAKRIEIILIESSIKRRAAKGDREALAKIDAEEKAAVDAQLLATRNPNADLSNADLDKKLAASQLRLEQNRKLGLFTEQQYDRQVRALDLNYLRDRLKNLDKDVTKQQEAANLRVEIARRENDEKLGLEKEAAEKRAFIIQTALQQAQGFSDTFFQIGNDQRAADLENLQHSKEKELEVAGENAELKAQIEENYRRRELAAKIKQAKYDKAAAIFSVALNTAQAVTAVLSTGGGTRYADFGISAGVLSALVIAQGLAQTVAILAKPLPQYYKGRAGGPAELARVGERGPELYGSDRSGWKLAAGDSLAYLNANDRVLTATRTADVLRDNELVQGKLVARQQSNDMARTTQVLRVSSAGSAQSREAAEARAAYARRDADRIVAAAKETTRAVQELKQFEWLADELYDVKQQGSTRQRELHQRYHNRGTCRNTDQ